MPEINLLPVEVRQRKRINFKAAKKTVLVVLFVLIFLGSTASYLFSLHQSAEKLARIEAQIILLQEKEIRVHLLREETAVLEEQLTAYQQVLYDKLYWGEILTAITHMVPVNTWLTGVLIVEGEVLVLEGYGKSLPEVDFFVQSLDDKPYFVSAKLRSALHEKKGDFPFVRFEIICALAKE